MIQFKKFTETELLKMSIYLLRAIGREIGVKAPASKKKEELVRDILLIQQGKLKPVPKTKKGAPPKMDKELLKPYIIETENTVQDYSVIEDVDRKLVLNDKETNDEFVSEGVLALHQSGFGFLRANNYENSRENDIYVSMQNIRKYNLRVGDKVKAKAKITRDGDSAALQEVISINDLSPELFPNRKKFEELIPYYPTDRIRLETNDDNDYSMRFIDLFAPLGMGQRGLIVAPPKTGKTTLLKKIARSIETNHKDVKLIVLLIDERPEEVTDIQRSVNGEVVFSTFDESPEHHIKVAELVINRAKRLVEVGQNVVILMDSITRLSRAYNNVIESSGRTLSGGLDPVALNGPKRFFGSARNIENGGSLTILSTALIETGSRMDDVIFEEFKGTGNMEIHLSKELSEKRIFPSIDLKKSGTRKEELLLSQNELDCAYKIRKFLSTRNDATDTLIEMLKKSKNNQELSSKIDVWLKLYQNRNEI